MNSSETILQQAAQDGTLDPSDWPSLLDTIVSRLDHVFHNEFPRPSIQTVEPHHILHTTSTPPKQEQPSSQESQTADKENAPPSTPPSRPPVPPFSRPSHTTPASSSNLASHAVPQGIPPELAALHNSIRSTLTSNFPQNPPHTVQRLAELVLNPKSHYRFLPPYLRALDRVVSVSSPTTVFPLPSAVLPTNTLLVNGASSVAVSNNLSSDESLGGALLTPIPWLRSERSQDDVASRGSTSANSQNELISESTEMVDGPNGAGRIETVTVSNGVVTTSSPSSNSATSTATSSESPSMRETGAVTQGELLRQEQQAGVVPISQTHPAHINPHYSGHPQPQSILPSNGSPENADSTSIPSIEGGDAEASAGTNEEQPDERPHARGPDAIGMEDMGPQQTRVAGGGLDIAAAVGRTPTSPGRTSVSPGPTAEVNAESAEQPEKTGDAEMIDEDAEGEAEAEDTSAAAAQSGEKQTKESVEDDVVVTDVDGNTDKKLDSMETQGEGKGGDAVDMSGI